MSKMGRIALELDEQASDLGYENYTDAFNNGCKWSFENGDAKLYIPEPKTAENALKMRNTGNSNEDLELELAILEWEQERDVERIKEIKQQLQQL